MVNGIEENEKPGRSRRIAKPASAGWLDVGFFDRIAATTRARRGAY
jgi:hypothetical protein